jgi:hypothetical protein
VYGLLAALHRRDGYDLFCNRDERKSRMPARPPRIACTNGVLHIAPSDPDGGGTWIGANEYGVTLCLVNAFPVNWKPGDRSLSSRGLLVKELLASRSALEAVDAACGRSLIEFALHSPLAGTRRACLCGPMERRPEGGDAERGSVETRDLVIA